VAIARSEAVASAAISLGENPFFGSLDPRSLQRLAAAMAPVNLLGGEVLFQEGEPADSVYLLVSGRLIVTSAEGTLAEVAPGELVGELALLAGRPRSATVRALRDSLLLGLPAERFRAVVGRTPDAALRLASGLAARIADREPVRTSHHTDVGTVAVVAAAGHDAALGSFCRRLARSLGAHGRARTIDRRFVERVLGRGAADLSPDADGAAALAGWLHDLELDHRFLVYQADRELTPWTRRCVRQADAVLVVADAAAPPTVGDVEAAVHSAGLPTGRVHLVLLHGTPMPGGTARWLDARPPLVHHNLRSSDAAAMATLGRQLAGESVGVVLGGGGPRGFAHLGVLKALEEAGIPIDAVGGTSIGAFMAAAYAMGWDHDERVAKVTAGFVRPFLIPPTLPKASLLSPRRLTRAMRDKAFFGERAIEDMWHPFFCISANISRPDVVVHDRGPVWLALRTSSSLPGFLPPVCRDGDLLVDGGVVNDLPVDVMRDRLAGHLVAVDLQPDVDLTVNRAFPPDLTGWQAVRERLSVPSAPSVLMRAKEVGGRRAQRERLDRDPPDLLLRPPTDGVSPLDFKGGVALIETGYRYAAEMLERSPLTATLTAS
jgi:predicted acylesterase/phospholipase RssA/CRP-like cAMP-binding protein